MNEVFEDDQFVPLPRERVFAFFATPSNLEAITPPWLRFRIVGQACPAPGPGVEYTYRLRIHGLPFRWKSRITDWQPGRCFTDVQLRGPYALWRHTHTFEDVEGGTRIRDRVVYRLPGGWLGRWIAGPWVRSDIRKIFRYRQDRTLELLHAAEAPAASVAGAGG